MKLRKKLIVRKGLIGGWICDDVYFADIYIFFGNADSFQEYMEINYPEINIHFKKGLGGKSVSWFNEVGHSLYWIWIEDLKDTQSIVHECLHCTFNILSDRDIDIDTENDEPVAYYLGSLANNVFKFRDLISFELKDTK